MNELPLADRLCVVMPRVVEAVNTHLNRERQIGNPSEQALLYRGTCRRDPALAPAAETGKINAQKIVNEILATHSEISALKLAATRSDSEGCKMIAATEPDEIGKACEEDELTAMKTNGPVVNEENGEFDATLPLHDSNGKIIGAAGMDFTRAPGQTKQTITQQAEKLISELEKKIRSKEDLFRPAEK